MSKPTLAESRQEFLRDWHPAPGHTTIAAAWTASLDALLAATRAEALEDVAKVYEERGSALCADDIRALVKP